MTSVTTPCVVCNAPFRPYRTQRYCSLRCRQDARNTIIRTRRAVPVRPCQHCEKPYQSIRISARFCSPACANAAQQERERAARLANVVNRTCDQCGIEFAPRNTRVRFCSASCRETNERDTFPSLARGVERGKVGALAELLVCADLLKRGYEVFRAVSPSASCDLLAMRNGTILRIEVRAVQVKADGTPNVPIKARDAGRQDIYAAVIPNGEVHYRLLNQAQQWANAAI